MRFVSVPESVHSGLDSCESQVDMGRKAIVHGLVTAA